MNKETTGTVISVSKQWWLKVNTKPIRAHSLDGALFPHIINVAYTVDGTEYTRRKWLKAGQPVPAVGSGLRVIYDEARPSRAKVL